MFLFKEYIPTFYSGFNAGRFEFKDFEDLKKKVKKELGHPLEDYELCYGREDILMAATKPEYPEYKFFVIGFVEDFDLTSYLKKFDDEYYTKGRKKE